MAKSAKQAVLLIHGIGEQLPMHTIRGFVDAIWTQDPQAHAADRPGQVWSKPDDVSDSFELRRLTTNSNRQGVRTDFFEFYWAHLIDGTTYGHVLSWAFRLLWRGPARVPPHLMPLYVIGWAVVAAALVAAVMAGTGSGFWSAHESSLPVKAVSVLAALLAPVLGSLVVLLVVGDAARYLQPSPPNIQCRHAIRQAGVKVLDELHQRGYQRIIVVGHSLGSVIGYDLLTHAWARHHTESKPKTSTTTHTTDATGATTTITTTTVTTAPPHQTTALDALQALARKPGPLDPQAFSEAQRALLDELASNGHPWRVSDFITAGSPLAHAALLLADDAQDLQKKQQGREFPTCPPTPEPPELPRQPLESFSYHAKDGQGVSREIPHHAAPFAATRWTNLYFPRAWLIFGDLVGGPLQALFGRGVRDVPVRTSRWGGLLSHTFYWDPETEQGAANTHIAALRQAVNLCDDRTKAG